MKEKRKRLVNYFGLESYKICEAKLIVCKDP